MVFIFFCTANMGNMQKSDHYWIIYRHEVRWPLKSFLFVFAHYWVFLKTITQAPNCIFPFLMDDTHIMGPLSEIIRTFDHLLTQLT